MGKVYAVANQKGGVGKSTTVVNLAAYLGSRDKRVLCIDIDAQGNTTTGLGIRKKSIEYSSFISRPAFFILSDMKSQFTACSGNNPVCLKPVGFIRNFSSL